MADETHRGGGVRAIAIPVALFLLTFICTTALGARAAFHFEHNVPSLDFLEDLRVFPEVVVHPRVFLDLSLIHI